MNQSVITKTLAKVKFEENLYSLGYRRLLALPSKTKRNFDLACELKGINHQQQKDFLENLTDNNFINWLRVN